jgi:2-oxoglutarate dehydrogenase E1 component
VVEWIQKKLGVNDNQPKFSIEEKKSILNKLNQAVSLRTLHICRSKRFSLEGGESIIPALDALIEKAAEKGREQFVMGMAHRGRLNVLAISWKIYSRYLGEFDGKDYDQEYFDGDVKYHLGLS